MSDEDDVVARAKGLRDAISSPWRWSGGEGDNPDLVFIDAAPDLIDALVEQVEQWKTAHQQLAELLANTRAQLEMQRGGLGDG